MKTWKIGKHHTLTWDNTPTGLFADILSGIHIELSLNGGSTWSDIDASAPNTGSYDWVVSGSASVHAVLRMSGLPYTDPVDGHIDDFSDITDNSDEFTISTTQDDGDAVSSPGVFGGFGIGIAIAV
jgi:hypothetical protein